MISPEVLRRFPFFGWMDADTLRQIAMFSEALQFEQDHVIFEERCPADAFYFLIVGSVDLFFSVSEETRPDEHKEYYTGSINPGEAFAISALIEPHVYVATARTSTPSDVLKVNAVELRKILEEHPDIGYRLMSQIAKVAMGRLNTTRTQLAAAWT